MIVISGQVRYETTADSTGLPLRFMGEQEHNIVDTVKPLTKYSVMVKMLRTYDMRLKRLFILLKKEEKVLVG